MGLRMKNWPRHTNHSAPLLLQRPRVDACDPLLRWRRPENGPSHWPLPGLPQGTTAVCRVVFHAEHANITEHSSTSSTGPTSGCHFPSGSGVYHSLPQETSQCFQPQIRKGSGAGAATYDYPEPSGVAQAMDALQIELAKLRKDGNLKQSVEDTDMIIELLESAREVIVADPNSASITLAKLQNPLKHGFDKINDDLKKVHKGHNTYAKALNQNFPVKALPTDYDVLASYPALTNRAIAMHLIREGQFDVGQTFLNEVQTSLPTPLASPRSPPPASSAADLTMLKSQELQQKFSNMYSILDHLKARNLHPAISWARENSVELENRGSNLEFELCKLQYLWLFLGPEVNGLPNDENNGVNGAFKYARQNFPRHGRRFTKDCQQLITAILFRENLKQSPYYRLFDTENAWNEVSTSFTREFCSLLGLSPSSPLYIACTAGAIALPTLLKLASIVKEKRTEWTTQNELPVEIALPRSMIFHAIFVCPVSKEQTTESNPPMMMPCGHVVAKESLQRLSKGGRFKCPYCPSESLMREAKEVVL